MKLDPAALLLVIISCSFSGAKTGNNLYGDCKDFPL